MVKKRIFIFLFEGFADWEIAFLTPEISKRATFELVYFTADGQPTISMGGMEVIPDISLEKVKKRDVDMLILPGGTAWETEENREIESLTKSIFDKGKSIAAICAATTFLARQGFLNHLSHTSNDLHYLKAVAPSYVGEQLYVDALAVTDSNIITAAGVAPIEFAREIFIKLDLDDSKEIESWFQLFKHGIWTA